MVRKTKDFYSCFFKKKQIFRERSWCAIYTTEELAYAVSLGYEILAYYECHNYKKQGQPFKKYIEALAFLKIKVRCQLASALLSSLGVVLFLQVQCQDSMAIASTSPSP